MTTTMGISGQQAEQIIFNLMMSLILTMDQDYVCVLYIKITHIQ